MKKFLLFALAALTATAATAADLSQKLRPFKGNETFAAPTSITVGAEASAQKKAPASRAEESLDFTLAGDIYSATRFQSLPAYVHEGFEFSAENATLYAGNQITAIIVNPGLNSLTQKNSITTGTVYLTYDLQEEPFYTQEVKFSNVGWSFNECTLDKPYTIEAGKAVYVMAKFKPKTTYDYYIVYDGLYHDNDEGGWVGYESADGEIEWDNIYDQLGYICMKAKITGNTLPQNGLVSFGSDIPSYVAPGEKFSALIGVQSKSAGQISSIEVTTTVGNEAPVVNTFNLSTPVEFGQRGILEIKNLVCNEENLSVPVKITVTKVNGVDNIFTAEESGIMMCFKSEVGYKQNVLIEEATGCWCGWCPRGIVLLEQIREKYTDGSVAIAAVHEGDEMAVSECQSFIYAYVGGFPDMWINRAQEIDFTMDAFEEAYNYFREMPAAAEITATATVDDDDKTVTVSGVSRFVLDSEGVKDRFALSFYLTEDGMGPYMQTNYYANGENGPLEGFDNKPSKTPVVYNDVARTIYQFPGISGSVPTTIKAGEDNSYSYSISLDNVTSQTFNVIAMVVDGVSGQVLNSVVIPASKHNSVGAVNAEATGVAVKAHEGQIVISGATAPVYVYTIDGRLAATATSAEATIALDKGIYIVNTGDTTVKVNL